MTQTTRMTLDQVIGAQATVREAAPGVRVEAKRHDYAIDDRCVTDYTISVYVSGGGSVCSGGFEAPPTAEQVRAEVRRMRADLKARMTRTRASNRAARWSEIS